MAGTVVAFKKYNFQKGIFGSEWNGLENFKFLFKTSDAWIITRNTICYNLIFIVLDLVVAVTVAIVLNELLNKRRAKLFQTIFMAPYFLSWVVVSFIAFAFLSVDNGLLNHILRFFGKMRSSGIPRSSTGRLSWYSASSGRPWATRPSCT